FYNDKNKFIDHIKNVELNIELNLFNYSFKLVKKKDNIIRILQEKSIIKDELYIKAIEIGLLSRIYSIVVFNPIISSTILPVERNSIYTFSDELSVTNLER